jgi:hypothetical protein
MSVCLVYKDEMERKKVTCQREDGINLKCKKAGPKRKYGISQGEISKADILCGCGKTID